MSYDVWDLATGELLVAGFQHRSAREAAYAVANRHQFPVGTPLVVTYADNGRLAYVGYV